MSPSPSELSVAGIQQRIHFIRGQRVILDSDLARIYGVTTARLNQQVRRNRNRFPGDFVFQLTGKKFENLMLQFATSSFVRTGRNTRSRNHGVFSAKAG